MASTKTRHDYHAIIGGGVSLPTVAKTTDYTATMTDFGILVDATGAAVTVTLPALAEAYNAGDGTGKVLWVKKTDASGNAVTVDGAAAETINGAATASLAAQHDTCFLMAASGGWHIIALSV